MAVALPLAHPGLCARVGLRFLGVLAAAAMLLSLVWAAPPPQEQAAEQRVGANELKAVYLYNFLQFVQWPEPRRGAAPASPPTIGVLGDTPLNRTLEELQATLGESGKGPIRVIRFGPHREGLDLGSCQLLFVGASESGQFDRIIGALRNSPVLTVADAGGFLESGGMIALVESEGRLRWMVNRAAAEKAGLRFNAQLLRLAIKVLE